MTRIEPTEPESKMKVTVLHHIGSVRFGSTPPWCSSSFVNSAAHCILHLEALAWNNGSNIGVSNFAPSGVRCALSEYNSLPLRITS